MAINLTRILKSILLREENTLTPKELEIVPGGSASTKTTLTSSQTAARTLTLPDATDTLVAKNTIDFLTNKQIALSSANDAVSGSAATLAAIASGVVRLTNASLLSVSGIPAGSSGQQLVIENQTTVPIVINDEDTGVTAANRIKTGGVGAITMLANSNFVFTYDSTAARWILTGGSGSGSGTGFKNILSDMNSKFEGGVSDWITYDDGAVAAPVDGTGGAPTVITITGTTSGAEVLQGLQSLKIAKSAADGQGEGTSVLSKTLDRADMGKPFYAYLSYDATHANYVTGDFKIYAYDITNSKLLTIYNDSNNGQLIHQKGLFSGVFYTEDTTAQIRLIVHCTSTNALAYNVFIDEVTVTPQATIVGPVITPFQTTTPTLSWVSNTTSSLSWRRVGDVLEGELYITTTGAPTATTLLMTLPDGLAMDTTKLNAQATNFSLGVFSILDAGTTQFSGRVGYNTATQLMFDVQNAAATYLNVVDPVTHVLPMTWASGDRLHAKFSVPILNWAAGASLSANDAGLQTVRFSGTQVSEAVTANVTNISFTEVKDNYNAWNTNQFTVPIAGDYEVAMSALTSLNSTLRIYKNGVGSAYLSTAHAASASAAGSITIPNCVKGDILSVRCTATCTVTEGYIAINRVPDFDVFSIQSPAKGITYLKELQVSGTQGGTATSGSFLTRTLNTQEGNTSFCSLSSSQFTLQPGTYLIEAFAPAFKCDRHKAKLRNVTDALDVAVGKSAYSISTQDAVTESIIMGSLTITSAKTFEIQHRVETTKATDGFGVPSSFGVSEVYTQVKIEKIL